MLAATSANAALAFVELGLVLLGLSVLARGALRLGISPIPLYLLVGLFFGTGGVLPVDLSQDFTAVAAEIGVLLLLFTLGLEYTTRELATAMRTGVAGGAVDLVLNATPGFVAGLLLGWDVVPAVLLGGVTYISSSGVIAKLLEDLGRLGNRETPAILSTLVFEDLVMAAYLPVIGVLLSGASLSDGVLDVAVAVAVVLGVLGLSAWAGPQVSRLLTSRSDEAVLLGVLGLVLLVGGLVQQVDVSAAVGAFVVGVAISGPVQERAADVIGPLRDLFAAIFFVVFALRIDPGTLPPVLLPALALAVVGVVTKVASGWWVAGRAGVGPDGRWRAGTTLVARGEFSIVIAGLGVAAGVEPDLGPLAAAYVLALAVAGSLLARSSRAPGVVRTLAMRSG